MSSDVGTAAADFIASHPGAAERLLATHTADGAGRCTGCTTPGYGTPHARWPCSPYLLATRAEKLLAARGARA